MTPDQLAEVRPRLISFSGQMFDGFVRADQRAKGETYLRGLLTDGARKSMQPMAQRLGVDHQGLQQFVTSSTWDHTAVRAKVARWATTVIAPQAYVIDDTGFPKDGRSSPCVARMYSGTLGKTDNCQIGVSVQMVTDRASLAANWRLFCPESWDDATIADEAEAQSVRERRERAGIGEDVRHRQKWRLALDMLDEQIGSWALAKLPVTADAGYGDATAFRAGLAQRGLDYVVAVKPTTSAYPGEAVPQQSAYTGRGRPPGPGYPGEAANLRQLALAAGRTALHQVTWRKGTKKSADNPTAAMRSRFLAIQVRPANRDIPRGADGSLPECWLLAEWPVGEAEPTDYWLSNMNETTPIKTLVRIAKLRWRVEHDYRELKTGLGLDHFEGRSYTGWHRHVTLVCLAQAFCTLLRGDPKADAPA